VRRGFSPQEARNQLDTAIDWGRYAELYDYDSDDEELTLEPGATDYL
jgi:NitT/TauT family transport system ATP-binding protein